MNKKAFKALEEKGYLLTSEKAEAALGAYADATQKVMFLNTLLCNLTPLGEHERRQVLSKYQEFKQMEKNMGASAMMTIAPIVKLYPADVNAFRQLLSECRIT